MGIANYAWSNPASFRRRCNAGQPTTIFLSLGDGGVLTAKDTTGVRLFSLENDANGFRMLDSQGQMVMETLPAGDGDATIEDRTGRELTRMRKENFTWNDKTYAWRTTLLAFSSQTTFELKQVGNSEQKGPLATLRLPSDVSTSTAELTAAPVPNAVPLGLLIFQALIMEHQWNRLRVKLMPLKKLTFSTKWL